MARIQGTTTCTTAPRIVEHIRDRIAEGNVSHLRIRDPEGNFTLELPVTAAVVAGGTVALAAPWIALLGAVAGLATDLHVEVDHHPEATHDGRGPPHMEPTAADMDDDPIGDNMPV